ncbi:GDYXXLXY domain-containing protein [candidate division KSB1 bacterium]|nr:GDYXXLXY domain-containing protein [candidate division KSB1 bacterium]
MNDKWIFKGLIAVIVFQVLVLASVYVNAFYPHVTGTEIKLRTVPVDPRSLFRGHYALLRYNLSAIPKADLDSKGKARENEIVYVQLKPVEDGIYEYAGASFTKPDEGLFLRGRLHYPRTVEDAQKYNVIYGIEALFAPMEETQELEKQLRHGGLALVMVAANGKAALKDVIANK